MEPLPLFSYALLLLLMVMNPPTAAAVTNHNITLRSTLTPLDRTSWLFSPSGDFAFGFQPLPSDPTNFLLAVWFDKTTNKTVVWYATDTNHNAVLCQSGFSVQLTPGGQLSLKDTAGQESWKANASRVSYGTLLDTGNLVLASSDGTPQWRSFDSPTDTILPSQTLGHGSQLLSHLMDDDYSNGRFMLSVQGDGNLVFYSHSIPTSFQYTLYWESKTVGKGLQLVFNESGRIYLVLNDTTHFGFTSAAGVGRPTRDFYQRGTLDPDGVFRHYIHHSDDEDWTVIDLKPSDICNGGSSVTGSGICGLNSYCNPSASGNNRTINCECPPNYSFIDEIRKYKGCQPNFPAQRCEADEWALFELLRIPNLDWREGDYESNKPWSEDQCKSDCLSDCFCAVAVYDIGDTSCWKKKLPLTNGRTGSSVQKNSFIRVPKANRTDATPPQSQSPTGADHRVLRRWIAAGSSILGFSVLVNVILATTIILTTNCASQKWKRKTQPEGTGLSLRRFTFDELDEASNGFNEEVGSGGFGRVYKGQQQSESGLICIAIKRLDKPLQDNEKEFDNEIRSISQTHHKNLVRLLGFCKEGTERILVYEFMSNGSLTNFLFDNTRPEWSQRIQIAMGIARGLRYLHEECAVPIIHCDIKLQNILMDDNLVARISDFGLAKLLRADQTRTMTGIRGTRGYVAPEWFKPTPVTAKVDVYSFGVVLLEIICCRKNVEREAEDEDNDAMILTFWAYDCYREGRVDLLVDGDEEAMVDMKRVERFVSTAIWCIQDDPSLRPSMQMVTQMLDGSVMILTPPDPSSYNDSLYRADKIV